MKQFVLHVTNSSEEINNTATPLFYKEMIQAWQKMKRITEIVKTREDVLNQIIWCNEQVKINGKVLSDSDWSQNGIQRIKDVMNSDGKMRIEYVSQIVKVKAEVMLKLNRIQKAIPRSWKERLKSSESDSVGKQELKVRKLTQEILKGDKIKVTEKSIYNVLMHEVNAQKSTGELRWEEILNIEIEWETVYRELNRKDSIRERKEIDFSWKCIQNVVWTEQKLKRIGQSNGICSRCGIEEEDLEHLLYMCECNENIWSIVEQWVKDFDDDIKISLNVIILGYRSKDGNINDNTNLINMIIDSVKWKIWKWRNDIKYNNDWCEIDRIIREIIGLLKWKKEQFHRMRKDKVVANMEIIFNNM